MSRAHQQRSEEDYNMESSIALRDRGILETQAKRRHRKERDVPIGSLFASTRQEESYGQARRRQADHREFSPYVTPIRERSSTQRPSVPRVMDDDEDTNMDVEERRVENPFGDLIGQEVQRQGAPVVQQLSRGIEELSMHVRDIPILRELTRQQQEYTNKIVEDLHAKFAEDRAERDSQLNQVMAQLRAESTATTSNLGQVLGQIVEATRAHQERQERQDQHINALTNFVQQLPKDGPVQIPAEVAAALEKIERDRQAALEDQFAGTKKNLEEIIEQMRVAANRTAAAPEGSGGEGIVPPPPPPNPPSNSGERPEGSGSQPPIPPRSEARKSQRSEQGGRGGNGNNGNGGNRARPRGPSPSDSSSSSDSEDDRRACERRQRRREERRRRNRQQEVELMHPPRATLGDMPKQAKIPFSGKADEDVRHWIDQMEVLIELQRKVRWDDQTKILWASLELTGSAAKFWRNFVERLSVDPSIGTWENFKNELRIQYGNRTSQEQAKQKMDKLRQTGMIDDYINEMQNLEWDAKVGPIVMKSMIPTGINSSLEQRLSNAIEEPEDFAEWLAWVRKVGRKDHEVKARKEILRGKDVVKPREEKSERRKSRNPAPRKTFSAPAHNSKASDDLGVTKDEKEKWQRKESVSVVVEITTSRKIAWRRVRSG
ncbi:uncharacterized protein LAJ45_01226 [Morchella importuna]|uniref:uncharacterized protein n=1 Tax=Morchella importuna TaxID=1174673 RepID=UPI001E8CA223|nr:uncharacterized protein LAJ45_01226 [Morchella importuna]KAH8154695.1 hypothetical protein LAJ45_01226 [Morchella importuna]